MYTNTGITRMPKILSHTPSWLSRPSTGFDFFQPGPQTKAPVALSNGQGRKVEYSGPSRTIVHRGTEVFVVVGNEIRWSDLVLLRDDAKSDQTTRGKDGGSSTSSYRACPFILDRNLPTQPKLTLFLRSSKHPSLVISDSSSSHL